MVKPTEGLRKTPDVIAPVAASRTGEGVRGNGGTTREDGKRNQKGPKIERSCRPSAFSRRVRILVLPVLEQVPPS